MSDSNIWDAGKWAGMKEVSFDFMTRYIFEKLSNHCSFRGKKVLELGAGTGRLSYLALKAGASSVTMVDSSVKAIDLAKGVFSQEQDGGCCRIIHSDIFEFKPEERFDLVFSSGLIEHFKNEDRSRILKYHVSLSTEKCLIVHPTHNLYSFIFNRLPPAVRLYGFQKSFSDKEIDESFKAMDNVVRFDSLRFHPFYTVPLLHNAENINRVLDTVGYGRFFGGLTLTNADVSR